MPDFNHFDEPRKADYPFPQGIPVAPEKYQKPLMKLARQMTRRVSTKITSPKNWKKKIKYY